MKINTEEILGKYFEEAYNETKKLLSIPSYKQEAKPGMPFGQGVSDVLDYGLNLAKEMGFETYRSKENKYGFLDYGNGEEIFVILCHLDVVPPGNIEEWITNPFTPIEKDGKLIGRGAFDDKGPTMMNLFALKYLKDNNFKPKYKIRLIFGLSEETTWECIEAYVKDFGPAAMGYTPDGEFPVVYAEKWVVNLDMIDNQEIDFTIEGGAAYNVICDVVKYKGNKIKEISEYLTKNKIRNRTVSDELIVQGTAGHGSLPSYGVNAATWICKALFENGIHSNVTDYIAENVHLDFAAKNIFKDIADETGELTQNLGLINISNTSQSVSFNYRIPVMTKPKEEFIPILTKFISEKYSINKYNIKSVEDAVYIPKDSTLIQNIMSVYQEVTGDMKSEPLAIGGGTFAKSMPNVVAFGAEFDMTKSTMHAYNEYVEIEDLKKMIEIYVKAIILLTK